MDEVVYRLVSTSQSRVLESPFLLRGERVAAFVLEEAALRLVRKLREGRACPTVYGCYRQADGTWLIGPASARPVGRYRQTLSLKKEMQARDSTVPLWKNVTVGRIVQPLDAFVCKCLERPVSRSRR